MNTRVDPINWLVRRESLGRNSHAQSTQARPYPAIRNLPGRNQFACGKQSRKQQQCARNSVADDQQSRSGTGNFASGRSNRSDCSARRHPAARRLESVPCSKLFGDRTSPHPCQSAGWSTELRLCRLHGRKGALRQQRQYRVQQGFQRLHDGCLHPGRCSQGRSCSGKPRPDDELQASLHEHHPGQRRGLARVVQALHDGERSSAETGDLSVVCGRYEQQHQ